MTLSSFYRFLLADLHLRGSVVLNSTRHDRRFAAYVHAAAHRAADRDRLALLQDMLASVEDAIELDVLDRIRALVASDAALDQRTFNRQRSAWTNTLRGALARGDILYGDLRAVADHLPPDVTFPWTRLETTDGAQTGFLLTVAEAAVEACRAWLLRELGLDVETRLSLDLAHTTEVVNHDDRRAPGEQHTRWRLDHAVQVPFPLAYMPRYAPILVHEVCHPSARFWLLQSGRLPEYTARYRDAVRDSIDERLPDDDPFWSGFAYELLVETLSDELALRMFGVPYVLAFASWMLGRVNEHTEHTLDYALPLGVRLRRMREHPLVRADTRYADVLAALDADVAEFTRRVLQDDPLLRGYRDRVFALVSADDWLPPGIAEVARAAPPLSDLLDRLWLDALARFEAAAPGDRIDALARGREGRLVDDALHPARWGEVSVDEAPETWRLLRVYVRKAGVPEPSLPALVTKVAAAVCPEPAPLAGAVLGPADFLVFAPGAHTRTTDGVDDAKVRDAGIAAYVVRRLAVRIHAVRDGEQTLYPRPGDATPGALLLVSDIQLDDEARAGRFLVDTLRALPAGVRVVELFRGFGWQDLTLVLALDDVRGIDAVRREVLTAGGQGIQRSISHLLVYPSGAASSGGDAGTAPACELRLSLRAAAAHTLTELLNEVRNRTEGLRIARLGPTIGLHDVHIDLSLVSPSDAEAVARLAWSLQVNGLATRSVTSVFPSSTDP